MLQTEDDLATALIAAHDGGPLLDNVPPHLVPADMAAVLALQDRIIGKLGVVGGWKVTAGAAGEPLCAPIPASRYLSSGHSINATRHRLVLVELEIAVRLGQDLGPDADSATVEAAIASLHPALELIGSPFTDRDAIDFNTKLADLQSNGAVVVGPPLDDAIKSDLGVIAATLILDGTQAKPGVGGATWSAILDAVHWLARHAASRGLPLTRGQVIITGSRAIAPIAGVTTIAGQFPAHDGVAVTLDY